MIFVITEYQPFYTICYYCNAKLFSSDILSHAPCYAEIEYRRLNNNNNNNNTNGLKQNNKINNCDKECCIIL